jgi:hypothetical protein
MGELVIGDTPPLEVSLDLIRNKRDELLKNCDFYLMPDYPILETEKEQWRTYRQALRDITTNINRDNLVIIEENGELEIGGFTWPTPPS